MEINAGLDRTKLPPKQSSVLGFWHARTQQAHDEGSWLGRKSELHNELGKFLEVCSGCNKNIVGKDAFMYGYLQAFCSPQCRNNQIALDEALQQLYQNHRQLQQLQPETLYNQFNCVNTHIRIHAVSKLNNCQLRFKSDS